MNTLFFNSTGDHSGGQPRSAKGSPMRSGNENSSVVHKIELGPQSKPGQRKGDETTASAPMAYEHQFSDPAPHSGFHAY
jgi:hypothetical protein